jgi:hypothetical protein
VLGVGDARGRARGGQSGGRRTGTGRSVGGRGAAARVEAEVRQEGKQRPGCGGRAGGGRGVGVLVRRAGDERRTACARVGSGGDGCADCDDVGSHFCIFPYKTANPV